MLAAFSEEEDEDDGQDFALGAMRSALSDDDEVRTAGPIVARPANPAQQASRRRRAISGGCILQDPTVLRLLNIPDGGSYDHDLVLQCAEVVSTWWLSRWPASPKDIAIHTVLELLGLEFNEAVGTLQYEPVGCRGRADTASRIVGREEALEVAVNAQLHILVLLQALLCADAVDLECFTSALKVARSNVGRCMSVVHNCQRIVQHFITADHAVREFRGVALDPDDEETLAIAGTTPMFPVADSGLHSMYMREKRTTRACERVLQYLYNVAQRAGLRRTGDGTMMRQVLLHPHAPVRGSDGQLVCDACGLSRQVHQVGHVCVFRPKFTVDESVTFGSRAWKELDKNSSMSEWVAANTSSDTNPAAWADAISRHASIVQDILAGVREKRLPVLEYTIPLWISFLNGCFDTGKATFHTYEEMDAHPAQFAHVVAHHDPTYFFVDDYLDTAMGPPDRSARTATFPPHLRRAYVFKECVCSTCGQTERYHASRMCRAGSGGASFENERCTLCLGVGAENCKCASGQPFPFYIDWRLAMNSVFAPNYESIPNVQFGHKSDYATIKFWLYSQIGRTWNPVDTTKENWQVMLSILGRARTGKSVTTWVIMRNVPWPLQFTAMANMQSNFGPENFATPDGKPMWVSFAETSTSPGSGIAPGVLKALVTGDEPVSFNTKFKRAVKFPRWPRHLCESGNLGNRGLDTSGDIARRKFFFRFTEGPTSIDGALKERIERYESPAIMFAACCAYEFAHRMWGRVGLDGRCPYDETQWVVGNTLREMKVSLLTEINPLVSFMQNLGSCDPPLVLDNRVTPDVASLRSHERPYVLEDFFVKQFEKFRRDRFSASRDDFQNWSEDLYNVVFEMFGVSVQRATLMWKGVHITGNFVMRVGILADHADIVVGREVVGDEAKAMGEVDVIAEGDARTTHRNRALEQMQRIAIDAHISLSAKEVAALMRCGGRVLGDRDVVSTLREAAVICKHDTVGTPMVDEYEHVFDELSDDGDV